MEADCMKMDTLAFECGVNSAGQPDPLLWRVHVIRKWKERTVNHVRWFSSHESAVKYCDWCHDREDVVVSVAQYELKKVD